MTRNSRLFARAAFAAVLAVPALACGQNSAETAPPLRNITEVAMEAGNFSTLVAALKAADLVATLQGPGPFTVFAPTDAAFAKLPAGTVDALLKDKAKLSAILTYHVVPGRVSAAQIMGAMGAEPTTVNGQKVDVMVRDGKVYVNGAMVTTADIRASNGIIHVIDTVLLPPSPAASGL